MKSGVERLRCNGIRALHGSMNRGEYDSLAIYLDDKYTEPIELGSILTLNVNGTWNNNIGETWELADPADPANREPLAIAVVEANRLNEDTRFPYPVVNSFKSTKFPSATHVRALPEFNEVVMYVVGIDSSDKVIGVPFDATDIGKNLYLGEKGTIIPAPPATGRAIIIGRVETERSIRIDLTGNRNKIGTDI